MMMTSKNILFLLWIITCIPTILSSSRFNKEENNEHGSGTSVFRGIKEWLHKVAPGYTVDRIVAIVFDKLDVFERTKCQHWGPHTNDLNEVVGALANHHLAANEFMKNESNFFKFCKHLLSAAVTYERTCNSHTSQHHGSTFSTEKFDNTSLSVLYASISPLINRNAELNFGNSPNNMGFAVEAYANRFLCTDEEAIHKSVKMGHEGLRDDLPDIWSAIIVFEILKGYKFLKRGEICPESFLHDIFKIYGYKCMTERSLDRFFQDLIHGKPPPALFQSHDSHNNFDDRRDADVKLYEASQSYEDSYNKPDKPIDKRQQWLDFKAEHNGQWPPAPEHPDDDSQCHRLWSHSSNFLHQTSHGISVLERHSWKREDRPLSVHDMTQMYYGDKQSSISYSAFLDMCPAMLHQLLFAFNGPRLPPTHPTVNGPRLPPTHPTVNGPRLPPTHPFVAIDTNGTSTNATTKKTTTSSQSYLYGSLSVLVISLCSLLGAAFMKLSRADVKLYIMGSLLSLAVGCLVADAALHLLPEVILRDRDGADDDVLFPDHEQKLCAFLGSVYAFFVLELFLSKRQNHSHKHNGPVDMESVDPEIQIIAYRKEGMGFKETNINNLVKKTNSNESQMSTNLQLTKPINTERGRNVTAVRNNSNGIQRSNEDCASISSDRLTNHDARSGMKALAWMIILGDGIHNFADGLAIGAAFAMTFTKGLSISITVLCHEIPHELGDFAVLISTGLSIKKAVIVNFLSSLTAFAGLYVGLLIGSQEEASRWIFSVGAGMFLYIALTDLVPECKEYFRKKPTMTMFLGQNVGLVTGYIVMLLLAMYEDKLEIKL